MGLEDRLGILEVSDVHSTSDISSVFRRIRSSFYSTGDVISQRELAEQLSNATESQEVKDIYLRDMNSIFGRALNKILDSRGYKEKTPDHYTYLDLPKEIIAATITVSDGRTILAYNQKHRDKLRNNDLFRMYINLHEHGHIRGEKSESKTEGLVKDSARYLSNLLSKVTGDVKELLKQSLNIEEYAKHRQAAQYGT